MTFEIVRYRTEEGVRTAIVTDGRIKLHVVAMEDRKLVLQLLPKAERRFMHPLLKKGEPYPLARAVRKFRRHGKAFGIQKKAKVMLTKALAEANGAAPAEANSSAA